MKKIGIFLLMINFLITGCQGEKVTMKLMNENNPVVKFATSKGDIYIELYEKEAPISAQNFLDYTTDGYYDGTIFHRVISGFVIQGGGFEPGMSQKTTKDPIKNEAANGLKNKRGTLSMARTNEVDSATSQFFVNVVDNDSLDHRGDNAYMYGYAVFGAVVEGMDVVDEIKAVETTTVGYFQDVPKEDVVVVKATVHKK